MSDLPPDPQKPEIPIPRTRPSVERLLTKKGVSGVLLGLFFHWDKLETVELLGLTSWASNSWNPPPETFPALNCAIRTMILQDHNCDELTLSSLLKSCGESMRTLRITGPHLNLKPGAFGRVLRDSTSPNLECLIIHHPRCWQHTVNDLDLEEPDDIASLLDIAFDWPTALRNLKTLTFSGEYMATDQLFARLPKSLVKLAWAQCNLRPPFIDALTSSTDDKGSLPNLMRCSGRQGQNDCSTGVGKNARRMFPPSPLSRLWLFIVNGLRSLLPLRA
ncbi:hypothetical protein PCASD_24154 [Puccinia coronata f. sp. avenae]|uniref:F-box domain-containing protein n=1 Tax=Puccinia coronata f. sp. avenae TaxID=200324 RepID=A0A2N5S075_9BASI|nr:hypothetical protein PCASD_24154 [Puccinia coronata f. sp. avenae]